MISRSIKQQSLLNAYWIPINFQNSAILTIAVPAALLHLAGTHHTAVLAILISVAGVLSMLVPPVAGAMSDHFRRKGGLRRPFIVAGAVVNVVGLFWLSRTTSIEQFSIALLVAVLGQSISLAAYQPLIPEAVDRSEWGLASGYQGIATLVGTVLGLAFAGLFDPATVFMWAAIIVLAGAFAAALTPERLFVDQGEHAHIGSWSDFMIAFVSRMFINFGLMLLMTFVLYFFNDVLKDPNPSSTTSIFGALSLVGAVLTSFWMGQLSDRVPRKLMVALAGAPMALAIFIFATAPGMHNLVLIALLFGLGYGAFASTGWALAMDSVPQLRDVARDLGIWGLASGLPGIIAPAFGGWLLAQYASPLAGYKTLFFVAAWCFVIGSCVVLLVGYGKGRFGISFQTVALGTIYPYYWSVHRIRRWGRLPWRRGTTIVYCNHQNDLDTIAGPVQLQVDGPWNRPIYSSGSRRMFEPGFMAMRLPWARSLLRNMTAARLFSALGITPIENELRTRSLMSLAWNVYARHGNLTLGAIFGHDALATFGVPESLTTEALFTRRWFGASQEMLVPIKTMLEPYRSEIFAQTRAHIERDLQQFDRIALAGNTFFLTPEGRHTRNGRLSPLLAILKRLEPFAETVWVAAMSYDVFVGKRLSLLVRYLELTDRSNLARSLKAARPVVVSQLLATWISEGGRKEFEAESAQAAVAAQLQLLPKNAFVDPELLRDPQTMTDRALAGMRRLGILADEGSTFKLTEQRKHPQFPLVDDMLAYQTNFFNETIEALHQMQSREFIRTG